VHIALRETTDCINAFKCDIAIHNGGIGDFYG
jgi:hypothetical protein